MWSYVPLCLFPRCQWTHAACKTDRKWYFCWLKIINPCLPLTCPISNTQHTTANTDSHTQPDSVKAQSSGGSGLRRISDWHAVNSWSRLGGEPPDSIQAGSLIRSGGSGRGTLPQTRRLRAGDAEKTWQDGSKVTAALWAPRTRSGPPGGMRSPG